jgi:nucleotide-binding universal stress UspA family protein
MDATTQGEAVGAIAARLAGQHGAHLVCVYGVARDPNPHDGFVRGEGAIHDVLERRRTDAEDKILTAGRQFAELTRTYAASSEFRVAWRDDASDDAVLRGLHCDLVVAGHPKPHDLPAVWTAEHLLLATATPVLIVPTAWTGEKVGDIVMIAWNRSREARRAVNDALPFLRSARRVVILVVDGDRNKERFGDDPGVNLVEHLGRHDIRADVVQAASGGKTVADVITEQTGLLNADLLVMGAYSRSRTAEVLFGGTTRTLLAQSRIPTLMSR